MISMMKKGLAVTDYLVDLAANPNFTNQSNEEAGKAVSLFEEGKLGAFFSGSWDRESIETALGENFGCAQPLVSEMNGWWSPAEAFGKAIVAGEVTHDNAEEKLNTFVGNVNAGGSLE